MHTVSAPSERRVRSRASASHLGVVHGLADLVLQVLSLGITVEVFAREALLGGGPLLCLVGVVLKPLVGVGDADLAPLFALVDVDVIGATRGRVAVGDPRGGCCWHGLWTEGGEDTAGRDAERWLEGTRDDGHVCESG